VKTAAYRAKGYAVLWVFPLGRFAGLVRKLEKDGYPVYVFDLESTPPRVLGLDELWRLAPVGVEKNFVVLGRDDEIVVLDFCPRCYSRAPTIDVFDVDFAGGKIATGKMCTACGFEFKKIN